MSDISKMFIRGRTLRWVNRVLSDTQSLKIYFMAQCCMGCSGFLISLSKCMGLPHRGTV